MVSTSQWSIRKQLLVMAVVLMFVIGLITLTVANRYGQQAAELSYDRLLTSAALQIADSIKVADNQIIVDLPSTAFETLSQAPKDRVFYSLRDPNGEHLTGYQDLPEIMENANQQSSLFESSTPHLFFNANYSGENVRFLVHKKLLTESGLTGNVSIQIGQTIQARLALIREINLKALQFVLFFFSIALALLMTGIWLVLRPVRQLNTDLSSRSSLDLSPIEFPVPSEIQQLIVTLNRLLAQLGNTLDRLKRYTSEAAHQLRTPLAGLKSQAQNALKETDSKKRNEQLQRAILSCDVLNDTVNQLLNQAVLAHRFQSEPLVPIKIGEIVKNACREIAVSALQQGVEVAYHEDCEHTINGDKFAIGNMIQNLLENAIKYGSDGEIVEVHLKTSNANKLPYVQLLICDYGPGIPDSEKPHVFERFYRTQNNTRPGSGIGLTIAREVALHHGAKLKLKDNQPNGLIVEILIPESRH